MQLFKTTFISLAVLLASVTNSMAATVTYKYVGNQFDYASAGANNMLSMYNNITATVTFDQAFLKGTADETNIVGGSISADGGTVQYDLADLFITAKFDFVNGNISTWYLEALQAGPNFVTRNDGDGEIDSVVLRSPFTGSVTKSVSDNPGTWVLQEEKQPEVSAVPVPAAAWLLGSSLIGFAGLRRKNKTQLV
jgi:hypothetical protein